MRNLVEFKRAVSCIQQQKRFALYELSGNASQNNRDVHLNSVRKYPVAAALPLPPNVDATISNRFSPARNRDITATAILSHQSAVPALKIDVTLDTSTRDPHVESYDCFGAVSLNSAMQSNVPTPFGGQHKFTHLNMPGGQWSQENKFMSHDLQSSHYMNLRREVRAGWSNYDQDATTNSKGIATQSIFAKLRAQSTSNFYKQIRHVSTDSDTKKAIDLRDSLDASETKKISRKEQLKQAVKEYGSTVIIFHIGISLVSLECFYLLVSSGIDLMPIVQSLGFASTGLSNKVASGASTFVIAYAIHKVFAPIRISITLASTPLIVRYLRKKGFLKAK